MLFSENTFSGQLLAYAATMDAVECSVPSPECSNTHLKTGLK